MANDPKTFDLRLAKDRAAYLVELAAHVGYRVNTWIGDNEDKVRAYFRNRQDRYISIDLDGDVQCVGPGSSWVNEWYKADEALTDLHEFIT